MKLMHGSLRKKLVILVLLATLPVFLVLLGTELQNREKAISLAEKDAVLYLSNFAEIQRRVASSTHTLLRSIACIPEISELNVEKSRVMLESLLVTNPIYTNVILVDLQGNVVAAGKNHDQAKHLNFGDRKQFKDAIAKKNFASGEFVVGKSSQKPIFPFGMPVQNKQGQLNGVIIIGVNLAHYGDLFERGNYPQSSFFGLCDHKGIRLFRYPFNPNTVIGKPIKKSVYEVAVASGSQGTTTAITSDGKKRVVAYEPIGLLEGDDSPYMYMFMGVDKMKLLGQAQSILNRLIFTAVMSLAMALFVAWFIGGRSIAKRLEKLSLETQKFSRGEDDIASNIDYTDGEIGVLAESFDTMVEMIRQREEEKIKLEAQLSQSQKMDAVGQLAGGVAHDFNNMLGGILGAGEILSKYLPDDPKAKKFHQMIMQSATRAADLTSKLLTFSRSYRKELTSLDFHEIIDETANILKNTVDRRIKIDVDLKAETSTVFGDSSQLQSALLNLGINASQAMPEGGTLSISSCVIDVEEVYCQTSMFDLFPGLYLQVELRDTGCGIPPDIIANIFEPFFTTKEQGKGTGLGLAAVYGTIKQHTGAITVYSELGAGTTFKILLPLADNDALVDVSTQKPIHGEGTILIVDDEEVMRLTAKTILEDLGYSVFIAENGEEALALFKIHEKSIALVLLDMVMPVMNGKDCFLALREIAPGLPVILSSGFTRDEDYEEMKRSGLKGIVRKPYLSAPLSKAVSEALLS